jgi:DNA-binding transcriptional regulator YiaG
MKNQTPVEMPTSAQMLEMNQVLSETLSKLQSAKNHKELATIVASLTKEQAELMKALEPIGLIIVILTALSKALGAYGNSPMTTEQLRGLQQSSGLSQTDLAKALRVPRPNISGWLNGSRPIPQKHAEKIHRICVDTATKRLLAMSASGAPKAA